jgi:FAD/FMN-containing dehydrogenase
VTTIEQDAVAALAEDFGGQLMQPDATGYDEARTIYNAMIDRRPALVVRPTGVADVIAAVNYARERNLPVAVKGGAHSVAGHSTCDDGVLLDLSRLKGVHVDAARGTARAAGGVQWGEYDRETQAFGLHTPGGRVTTTGVGGFTLGGGYGWTSPKFGLTCDNLVSADVVTAAGQLVTASETQNEDLFWGLRGGGGNFGVVTSFEYRVHPLGPIILGGLLLFPLEQAEEAMAAYAEVVADAPDELGTAAVMLTAPPEEFVPPELHGKPALGFVISYAGDPAEGAQVVAPLKAVGPAVDLVGPMPYRALQAIIDPMAQPGFRNYWRGLHLTGLNENVVETFLRFPTEGLSPLSFLILFQHGGAVARVPDDATAFSHREATFMAHPIGCWESPAEDEHHLAWVNEVTDAFEPFRTGGIYLNFTPDTGEDVVRAGFSSGKYERLAALKAEYDPDNMFRFNQNIAPMPVGAGA